MGFLKNRFGGSRKTAAPETEKNTVYIPVKGTVIPLEEIGDGVFSEGILGKGCGIRPEDETVTAPFDGTVILIPESKHAVGLRSEDGIEVMIHVGLDTVSMNGKGFSVFAEVNDTVKRGQKLLTFSKKEIAAAGFSDTIAVVVINSAAYKDVRLLKTDAGNWEIKCTA